MSKKFKFDHLSAILDYKETYFKNKPEDCILYAEDGTDFKIHKEVIGQTEFLRKILFTTISHCCDTIEIICPCTKEELEKLVHFLYHGEIQCVDVFESFRSQEDLSKIFGFPEDFNDECQIATLCICNRKNGDKLEPKKTRISFWYIRRFFHEEGKLE